MEELVKKLYDNPDKFNYEVVKEIENKKGEINKYLLAELDKNIENFNKDEYFPIFVDYSLFLLAEFKEKKAFPLILKMLSIPKINGYHNIGEGTMESLSAIIVSVFDGDFDGLNKIIESKKVDSYIRDSALKTYIYFYNNGLLNKNDLIKYLRKLITLYKYDISEQIYDSIFTVIMAAHLKEMIPDVKEMFAKDLLEWQDYPDFIDNLFDYDIRFEDVEPITSTVDSMSGWYCFNQDENEGEISEEKLGQKIEKLIDTSLEENINIYKKVGRNDPCPCGSGKKFKKCCIDKVDNILPYQKYISDSLKHYPKKNDNKELDFYSFYDEECIKIDQLLYKVLKKKRIPLFIKRDIRRENEISYKYLDEAYPLIKEIVKKKKIKRLDDFDEQISIHFGVLMFFKCYTDLMLEKIRDCKKNYIENLGEIINYFYTTFEIPESRESLFLEKINVYYLITEKYAEAIKFFESKLSNEFAKYDTYGYLFNLYSLTIAYDKLEDKIDKMIAKETDKELRENLNDLKLDFIDEEDDEYEDDEDDGF